MKEAIGGYFGFESRQASQGFPYPSAIKLNTARNCFEYILYARRYSKIYLPYYTCDALLEPLDKSKVAYSFYQLNAHMEPMEYPELQDGEAFLYTNYFGLKQRCVEFLAKKYPNQLIVDNAQAFYAEPLEGVDTFYSPRKFFGVPDGGLLFTSAPLERSFPKDVSLNRMVHLKKRCEGGAEAGYEDFRRSEDSLNNQPIRTMSEETETLLASVDYRYARDQRRKNFLFLSEHLNDSNELQHALEETAVPMVYPYLAAQPNLKQKLIDQRIFVATYWPNVLKWVPQNSFEEKMTEKCLFLPVDQRYDSRHMSEILSILEV